MNCPLIGLAQSSDPGEIEYTRLGEILRCPWHGWEFDIRTGQSYCDPKKFRTRAPFNIEPGTNGVKVGARRLILAPQVTRPGMRVSGPLTNTGTAPSRRSANAGIDDRG
jgi:hypothetical protein